MDTELSVQKQDTMRVCAAIRYPGSKPGLIFTYNSLEFTKTCEDL